METSARTRGTLGAQWIGVAQGIRRRGWLALVLVLFLLLIPSDGYLGAARQDLVINRAVGGRQFNLPAWEVQAIEQKLRDAVTRPDAGLTPLQEHDLVVDYMRGVGQIADLTGKIEAAAAGVGEGDLAQKKADLERQLESLRARQAQNRPAVERIIEKQVASVLDELGFTTFGQVFPPVSFQFTESPNYLVISPRQRIRVDRGEYLDPAMPLSQIEQIETEVANGLDKSTIIEGTGGFSSYPTMVLEYPVLSWVLDTVSHEWTHTYLFMRPLGWNYESSPAMRTINETVASMVGDEVSQMLLEKFYPELVGPAAWPMPLSMRPDWLSKAPVKPAFEYAAFMRETRLQADKLLSEGKVSEAEAYMEARRQELVKHGYAIRKLNQAYFAFHGSYQVGAAAGTDPIGGKLRALRARLASLPAFLNTVAHFSRAEDLDATLELTTQPAGIGG
ncbi:MAG: hypothetical protein ACM30E_11315 [Nitrososphaerales archaeon]